MVNFFKRKKPELSDSALALLRFMGFADEWLRNNSDIKELRFVRLQDGEQEEGGGISALEIYKYSDGD